MTAAEQRVYDQAADTAAYRIGNLVSFEAPDGTRQEGIISEMFIGPMSGKWIYEIHGDGFYEEELSPAPEPLRAA